MGTNTFINIERRSSAKPGAASVRRRGVDLPLLVIIIGLCAFGLLMVYSASWDFSFAVYEDAAFMFNRQVLWMVLGVTTALLLARVDYHLWRLLVVPVMVLTIAMLIGVLVLNNVRLGASRTLAQGSVQPSELAKVLPLGGKRSQR